MSASHKLLRFFLASIESIRRTATSAGRRSGFTLVELMTTVSLIGVMGLLTAPGLSTMIGNYRVNGAAQVLASQMSLARVRSISQGKTYHVAFDTTAQTITIYRDDDNDWTTANVAERTYTMATDFQNVTVGYNAAKDPDGTDIPAAAVFGTTTGPVRAAFQTNGLLVDPGLFYLIPTADLNGHNDRMRAIRVSRAGQVTRYRYKSSANPPWEEY